VALSLGLGPGGDWARDTRVILDNGMEHFVGLVPDFSPHGLRLLWLEPWKGAAKESLAVSRLHPLFIEVCRRIRLQPHDGAIRARRAGTDAPRIEAKDRKGNLADPWIPVRREDSSAFNSPPNYSKTYQVLFDRGAYQPALLQLPSRHDRGREASVVFKVLVRGEGKTEGYLERSVAVPAGKAGFLAERSDEAAEVAQAMAAMASEVEYKALKPALVLALQAARPSPDYKQPETTAWAGQMVRDFDEELDRRFFAWLWPCLDILDQSPEEDCLAPWRAFLREQAGDYFQHALSCLPVPGALRYKAWARAESRFHGGMNQVLDTQKGGIDD